MSDLLDTVTLLGALQGAGLAALLYVRRRDALASRLLGTLVGGVAAMLLLGWVGQRWGWSGYPHLLALGAPLPFLFTPLLYFYVLALTRPLDRLDARVWLHALPCLAFTAFMANAFYFQSAEVKLEMARAHVAGNITTGTALFNGVRVAQAVAYLAAAYRALGRHARRMQGYYSDLSRVDLRWLSTIVLCNALIWSLVAAQDIAEALSWHVQWASALDRAVQVGSALFIFLIGYIFLGQPELTQNARAVQSVEGTAPDPDPPTPDEPPQVQAPVVEAPPKSLPRYQRNRLADEEATGLAERLRHLMQTQQPFRDASLTAQTLADELAISPHMLSQVLNLHIGKTFYAFVNEHRAEALKSALSDPDQGDRGVLELALEAGFNSKSTLNSFFKQHTGMTPTRFRQQQSLVISRG
jgi:AraC-like DNA-binding protein